MSDAYKAIAKGLVFEKLKDVDLPTSRVNLRRLTVDEIKAHIQEEFGKAKDANKTKGKELPKGWGDAEIAKEIDWVKALDLQEFFVKKK